MNKSKNKELFSWIITIVVAIILAMSIRTFLVEPVRVQQTSMYPTLKNNDKVILNKLTYRLSDPQYGDIVVVKIDDDTDYVKRVIGLPGDTIEIKNMTLYRNDKKIDETYLPKNIDKYSDFHKVTVPKGYYFLMGDNRKVSIDSRDSSVGFIARDQFLGKVVLRLFPISTFGSVY